MMTAAVVNGRLIPRALNSCPKIPLRPNAINNTNPATDGGRTIGRSIKSSIQDRNLNFQRASMYASVVPNRMVTAVVIVLVIRLNFNAFNAWSDNIYIKKPSLKDRTNND